MKTVVGHGWRASGLAIATMIAIGNGTPALAQDAAPVAPVAPPSAATFDIRAFQVRGNKLLPPDAVERAVYPFMGPGRSEADVEAARAALQKAFEDAGYVAVSVFIPEQGVTGGILQLEVQPQAIGTVVVEGTKNPDAVRTQAPSLTPGDRKSVV